MVTAHHTLQQTHAILWLVLDLHTTTSSLNALLSVFNIMCVLYWNTLSAAKSPPFPFLSRAYNSKGNSWSMKPRWLKLTRNHVFSPKLSVFQGDSEDEHQRIRFEGEDHPERHEKLRRRDTPHYLKDKRINMKGDDEKVKEILAKSTGSENEQEGEGTSRAVTRRSCLCCRIWIASFSGH